MLARLELCLYGRHLDALIAEKMQRAPKEIRSFYGVVYIMFFSSLFCPALCPALHQCCEAGL